MSYSDSSKVSTTTKESFKATLSAGFLFNPSSGGMIQTTGEYGKYVTNNVQEDIDLEVTKTITASCPQNSSQLWSLY